MNPRTTCLWLLLLTTQPCLYAQFCLSIRLGTSSNGVHLTGNAPIDVGYRVNGLPGTTGVATGFRFSTRWSLEAGLNYTVKGYDDYTADPLPPSATSFGNKATGFRFHYAEFCPQVIYRLNSEFALQAGGYTGYLFKRQKRMPGFSRWDLLSPAFDGFFRDTDAGLTAGLSIHYQRLFFFTQFQFGLYPIAVFSFSDGIQEYPVRMYNRTFMLGVGYTFMPAIRG
jgi:hypothetical protein